jgi:uncharacterized membrane protein
MRQAKASPEVQVNWDVILMFIAILLLSTGMWGVAIGAVMVLLR